jgi:hypothetical protein
MHELACPGGPPATAIGSARMTSVGGSGMVAKRVASALEPLESKLHERDPVFAACLSGRGYTFRGT